jgi:hypothetical protein
VIQLSVFGVTCTVKPAMKSLTTARSANQAGLIHLFSNIMIHWAIIYVLKLVAMAHFQIQHYGPAIFAILSVQPVRRMRLTVNHVYQDMGGVTTIATNLVLKVITTPTIIRTAPNAI